MSSYIFPRGFLWGSSTSAWQVEGGRDGFALLFLPEVQKPQRERASLRRVCVAHDRDLDREGLAGRHEGVGAGMSCDERRLHLKCQLDALFHAERPRAQPVAIQPGGMPGAVLVSY